MLIEREPATFSLSHSAGPRDVQDPRYWELVDQFPVTITGKVQKFVMREMAAAELPGV